MMADADYADRTLARRRALSQRVAEHVDADMVRAYAIDGAVCIRQLLSADEIEILRAGIDANLAAPSPRAKVATEPTTLACSSKTSATGSPTGITGRRSSNHPSPKRRRA